MILESVNALAGQRAALEAPADRQLEVLRERVAEPLRPFWEVWTRFVPEAVRAGWDDAGVGAVRGFGVYGPENGVGEGLRALEVLERAGSHESCGRALEEAAKALAPEKHGVHLDRVTWTLVLANPGVVGERQAGYTGAGGYPGLVMVMAWPTDYNVPRLPAAAAHELHHNVRLSFEPWSGGTTVGQYLVLEGLAEAFASELLGEDKLGPWAMALSEAQLEAARPRLREALDLTGDIRGYMFGDWAAAETGYTPRGLPDFVGYSAGYRLVRAYLERTGRSAAEATYVPWREIVEESRYL